MDRSKTQDWQVKMTYHLYDLAISGRWVRLFYLENNIRGDDRWVLYTKRLLQQSSNSICWEWLKDPNMNMEYTIDILNHRRSFPIQMKEYIIQRRPDLIGQIEVLPRKLRRKYKEELNLSGVEI